MKLAMSFKTYYDYVFDENKFTEDFSSILSTVDSYYYPDSEVLNWYDQQLKELDLFIEKVNVFQKVMNNHLQYFEWDPPGKFYAKVATERSFFPDLEIFKTKKKDPNLKRILFKNSLVYYDKQKNSYYTDFYIISN